MEGGGEIGQSLPLQPRKLLYVWLRSFPTAMQFSSIFDYRLLAVISAQSHFTIWQLCYLRHLDLSGCSISSASNLHVCISLGSFVRQRQSVRTVKDEGNFSAQISFHLWYQNESLTRWNGILESETFEWALKFKHSNTKAHLVWFTQTQKHAHIITHSDTLLNAHGNSEHMMETHTLEKTLEDTMPLNTADKSESKS